MKPNISQETLEHAVYEGSKEVKAALQNLSNLQVVVTAGQPKTMTLQECAAAIGQPQPGAIAAYSEVTSGSVGAAFLILTREDALTLADVLNNRPIGTTGILKEVDRDAVKETLNILSNSYFTSLCKTLGICPVAGVPRIVTAGHIANVTERLASKKSASEDLVIVFNMTCTIAECSISASLTIIFNAELVELMSH